MLRHDVGHDVCRMISRPRVWQDGGMSSLHLLTELRRGFAQLLRSPGFALAAILLLGTGVGAVTVVFSLINAILVRPLPFQAAHELVGLQAVNRDKSVVQPAISVLDFRDFAARQTACVSTGAYRPDFATWQRPGEQPVQLNATLVTEGFFATLGSRPLLGRLFTHAEFSVSAPAAVLLSEEVWRSRFDASPGVVGTVITLNDRPTTVIGVMPAVVREPAFVDVWVPFAREAGENFVRDSRYWIAIGRRAPQSTAAQVHAEAAAISADLEQQHPETNQGWRMAAAPLHALRVKGVSGILWLLFGATGLLLLVACFNLASLLLGRGLRRRGEMALRQALGAPPAAVLRQVLFENLVLALPGAAVGLATAWVVLRVVVNQIPPELLPRSNEVSLDPFVLAVAGVCAVAAALLAGLIPALQAARVDANDLIKESSPRASAAPGVRRLQRWLLVGQVALTFVVLSGATLLWRSLARLTAVPAGVSFERVYATRISPAPSRYDDNPSLARYFDNLVAAVESVPGVEAAAVDASAPLGGISLRFPYTEVGGTAGQGSSAEAVYHFVSPDFNTVLRLPLRGGRALTADDHEAGAAVVWVNETLARQLAPDGNALGRKLRLVPWLSGREHEIAGVFADSRQDNLADPVPPQLFVAQRQVPWFFSTLMVRLQPGVPLPVAALREAVQKVDPALAGHFAPMEEWVSRTAVQPRLLSHLFAVLAATTLGFTLFGIYACVALTVTHRTPEFGLRMALGASPARVAGQMTREVGSLVGVGLGLGFVAALAFGGVLQSQLFGVEAHDPQSLVVTGLLLAVAGLISAAIPVLRASRIPPALALRHT